VTGVQTCALPISGLAKQTIAVAKQYAGDEVVDQVVASIPGLGQFI
jgi:hypothetical protein